MDMNWMLEEYDGIVYVSDVKTYDLLYMNRAARAAFHLEIEDVAQKKCYAALQGFSEPCPFCTNPILKDTEFYEWEYRNPVIDKTFLLKDRKLMWDDRPARIEFCTDITDYHKKIRQKEYERDSVLKSLPGGIARVDARDARTILWYGARFLDMIGYTKEQFEQELNCQCSYVHPDDLPTVTNIMEELQKTGKVVITEIRIVTRSGEVRTLTTTFSYEDANRSEDGIPSFYSIGIDITEIKEQQERQRRALEDAYQAARVADRAKTDFLSRMSHDIRTPLNAILGMAAIARSHKDKPERIVDSLNKIDLSGRHLLELVNEVLDMARIESGAIDLTSDSLRIDELIHNVLDISHPLLEEKHLHFSIDTKEVTHFEVMGDAVRIQQIMMNFLSNAIKYTPEGGSISLGIRENKAHAALFSFFDFIFEDNGIGMSPDFLSHIFEPFTRAEDSRVSKIQGSGLGMAISDNLVRMMNGSIQVKSEPGIGSRFTVSIPLGLIELNGRAPLPGVSNWEAARDVPKNYDYSGKRVLLVEDNTLNMEIAHELLASTGIDVEEAGDGQIAVEMVTRSPEDYYHLIFMDVQMPVMDGYRATEAIRALPRNDVKSMPIIAMTANAFANDVREAMRAGMTQHMAKPINVDSLLATIHLWLGAGE